MFCMYVGVAVSESYEMTKKMFQNFCFFICRNNVLWYSDTIYHPVGLVLGTSILKNGNFQGQRTIMFL